MQLHCNYRIYIWYASFIYIYIYIETASTSFELFLPVGSKHPQSHQQKITPRKILQIFPCSVRFDETSPTFVPWLHDMSPENRISQFQPEYRNFCFAILFHNNMLWKSLKLLYIFDHVQFFIFGWRFAMHSTSETGYCYASDYVRVNTAEGFAQFVVELARGCTWGGPGWLLHMFPTTKQVFKRYLYQLSISFMSMVDVFIKSNLGSLQIWLKWCSDALEVHILA